STISRNAEQVMSLSMAADGQHVLAEFYQPSASLPAGSQFPLSVFRVSDGARVLELGDELIPTFWGGFTFVPDGAHLYGARYTAGGVNGQLSLYDLDGGGAPVTWSLPSYLQLYGMSAGCPLVSDQTGAYRACSTCSGPTFAQGAGSGVLSHDGLFFAAHAEDD